jgi:predicted ArsR family transcriptional regulator
MKRNDVLAYIRTHPGCTVSDIARGLGIYRSAAEAHVRHLRISGLVDRVETKTRNSWGRPMKTFRYFINQKAEGGISSTTG